MLPTICCSDDTSSNCLRGCCLMPITDSTSLGRGLLLSHTILCVCVSVGVSEQSFPKHRHSEDESDRRVKGAERPTREATVKTVISLLARCPLLVQQHIIGGGARRACGCVCVWVCSCKPSQKICTGTSRVCSCITKLLATMFDAIVEVWLSDR